ncbi:MAG: serine/threonine-protein kinase [Gemmatimonadales bacterium]
MDPARWEQVQALFHAVADLPPNERTAALLAHAAGDETLIQEVRTLLDADQNPDSLLGRDLASVASAVLGEVDPRRILEQAFGPYRLVRLLGEGGMGVVYLGERADLASVAAIKILRDTLSPSRRLRFAAEQRTLAQLSHPGIAQLFDAGTLPDGTPWFAMEYVEGLAITEYCRQHRSTLPERLAIFRAAALAVQHAHQHAVIHRDIKPSNVLVRSDGAVKLLDFGIAKHFAETDPGSADQTRTGLRLLTPAYAAPEQFTGGPLGTPTDVYALGAVLFELLSGRRAFEHAIDGPDGDRLNAATVPPRPSSVPGAPVTPSRSAWADLDVICRTAMHPEPARRYQTVDALVRDLDRYLTGTPLEARPDTIGYRLGKFVRRNARAVVASGLVAAAAVAMAVFYTLRLADARDLAVAQVERTERIQRFMLNLFAGGEDAVGPADSLRVVTMVERGIQEARGLSTEPQVQAELYLTLGGIAQKLGRIAQADTLIRAGLDLRRERFGPAHPDVAKATVGLGLLRLDQAQLETADSLTRHGLAASEAVLPANHPDVLAARTAVGQVLVARGDYAGAIALLAETRDRYPADAVTPEFASTVSMLASAHFYAGDYHTSDSLNRQVLAMTRQLYGPSHPLVAEDLANLGAIQQDLGHYPEAERFHRQALAIIEPWYGADHHRTALALTLVGRSLLFQQRRDEAVPLLERALAIRERVYGVNHPSVASTLSDLGSIALAEDRLDEADTRFSQMAAIYRAVHGPNHYLLATALSNLASVAVERRDYLRAERLYREALEGYRHSLGADNLNTGIARIKLGRALLRQNRYRDAATESLAGYDILTKQADPAVSFLRAARTDLAAAYTALGMTTEAERFRAELASAAATQRP